MSTHAALIIKNPAPATDMQKVGLTMVHFDGYPTGVGAELLNYLSGTTHAAALLLAGNIRGIEQGEIEPHHELDREPAEWFADLETAIASLKNGPAAYAYLWDGAKWQAVNPDGRLVSIRKAIHL